MSRRRQCPESARTAAADMKNQQQVSEARKPDNNREEGGEQVGGVSGQKARGQPQEAGGSKVSEARKPDDNPRRRKESKRAVSGARQREDSPRR